MHFYLLILLSEVPLADGIALQTVWRAATARRFLDEPVRHRGRQFGIRALRAERL